jgi:hypothetical protein
MLAGLLATTASAALWLTFSTTTATPGTLITVRTLGEGSLATVPAEARLPVFLVRADAEVTSPDDDRLIPLGELTVDGRGNGELRFRVPDVPAATTRPTHTARPVLPALQGESCFRPGRTRRSSS